MDTIHGEAVRCSQQVSCTSFKSNCSAVAFWQALGYRVVSGDAVFAELQWDQANL